ncbi:ARPP-2 domain-containing protein [Hyalangium rubrum]|uniref:ARG and Rhodanese-Phosphatase-superfamily-associated domain-containing protein n=1 Tax=Hyalangium rubrum TaxID=3103134 RepID=A0ABU5HCN7_9BACT|nr:hypothetical protein [Hyalangium sp. s54d21]MDY7230592.1 hypothetical protein [Hyalangium sp. s54d21]
MGRGSAVTKRIGLQGLRLAPAQVYGNFRLVPVLRDTVRGDLRFARRTYPDDLAVVALEGEPMAPGLKYVSYIPHGMVMSWDKQQVEAVVETRLVKPDGKQLKVGPFSLRVLHRMVRREDRHQLRLLPLHLAMEGFLALQFGGPEIAWQEYSREALSTGLSPRVEQSVPGWANAAFAEALRVFEIHEQQVGVLIFRADLLMSAFILAHPDDYRALHRPMLEDFYGELLLQYGFLEEVSPLGSSIEPGRVSSLGDLRAEVARLHQDWAAFVQSCMAGGLMGVEVSASRVYEAGPFTLERFVTGLQPSEENHLGEMILREEDGTIEYLKTYRLSAAQTRRAYLLKQVSAAGWNLEDAARNLRTSRDELMVRMRNAGFGYLLKPEVLSQAVSRHTRR